jgi:hypothetical protein
MTGIQAIVAALKSTKSILDMYVADLSDADLFVRPAPTANHIAWQLGHVIAGDPFLMSGQGLELSFPKLPDGFDKLYDKEGSRKDGPDGFLTKAEYLGLFEKVRAATIAAVEKLTDADLDKPTQGPMAPFASTLGELFLLIANHTLMHAGQFTVLRRKLGKPVLF